MKCSLLGNGSWVTYVWNSQEASHSWSHDLDTNRFIDTVLITVLMYFQPNHQINLLFTTSVEILSNIS